MAVLRAAFVAALAMVALLSGCTLSGSDTTAPTTTSGGFAVEGVPIVKVYVDLKGTIYLDGEPVRLADLEGAFAVLAEQDGAVEYHVTTKATRRIEATVEVLTAVIAFDLRMVHSEAPSGPGWPEVAFSGG